jgi:hypothetical protein
MVRHREWHRSFFQISRALFKTQGRGWAHSIPLSILYKDSSEDEVRVRVVGWVGEYSYRDHDFVSSGGLFRRPFSSDEGVGE